MRREAVSAFSRESLAKSFPEDRRKSSRFTIEYGEIYLLRPTAIVLRVHLIFFINKEFVDADERGKAPSGRELAP